MPGSIEEMSPGSPTKDAATALADRLFEASVDAFDLVGVYLGDRLGWYRSLADDGPATPPVLAARTSTDGRYAREWLEQQATTGILAVDPATIDADDPDRAVFSLPPALVPVLVDGDSLTFSAPLAQLFVAAIGAAPRVVEAFRTGEGVPYADYGPDLREGEARSNGPAYRLLLADWLAAIPHLDERLRRTPAATVADLGCGHGESTVAIARAYPGVTIDGLDLDPASIEAAARLLDSTTLADRVRFLLRDAADPELEGTYDLVTMFEMFHDLDRPVETLVAARGLLAPGGSILIADEAATEAFSGPDGADDRAYYGWSITHCLPASRTRPGSAATGTVIRPRTVRRYAEAAGLDSVEVLDIESDTFRFYLLRP